MRSSRGPADQTRDAIKPRAILFDLDDTLILAYARPDAAWLAVAEQFAAMLAPLTPAAPQRLGIHAVWYDAAAEGLPQGSPIRPHRTITRLDQLLDAEHLGDPARDRA